MTVYSSHVGHVLGSSLLATVGQRLLSGSGNKVQNTLKDLLPNRVSLIWIVILGISTTFLQCNFTSVEQAQNGNERICWHKQPRQFIFQAESIKWTTSEEGSKSTPPKFFPSLLFFRSTCVCVCALVVYIHVVCVCERDCVGFGVRSVNLMYRCVRSPLRPLLPHAECPMPGSPHWKPDSLYCRMLAGNCPFHLQLIRPDSWYSSYAVWATKHGWDTFKNDVEKHYPSFDV